MSFQVATIISMMTIASPIRNPHSCAFRSAAGPEVASNPIEQKVTAIEQRDREEVQETDRLTDSTAVRLRSSGKPTDATCPETWAMRSGPPS